MSTVIKVEGCGVCPMGDNGHFCNYGDFPLDRSLRLGVRPLEPHTCPLAEGPVTIELKVRKHGHKTK